MHKLNITEKAENDLLENAEYLKNVLHSKLAANNLVDGFYKTIEKLMEFPKSYPLVDNDLLKPFGIRFVQVRNFTVFFVCDDLDELVFVLRFIYSRRNWKDLLGDDFLTTIPT